MDNVVSLKDWKMAHPKEVILKVFSNDDNTVTAKILSRDCRTHYMSATYDQVITNEELQAMVSHFQYKHPDVVFVEG